MIFNRSKKFNARMVGRMESHANAVALVSGREYATAVFGELGPDQAAKCFERSKAAYFAQGKLLGYALEFRKPKPVNPKRKPYLDGLVAGMWAVMFAHFALDYYDKGTVWAALGIAVLATVLLVTDYRLKMK